MYKPRGYNDIISSANKPEIPIAVHHTSVPGDIKVSSYRSSSFLWIVLGIADDMWELVWTEQKWGLLPIKRLVLYNILLPNEVKFLKKVVPSLKYKQV